MQVYDRIRDLFGGLSQEEKEKYFNELSADITQLQSFIDFLHNKNWEGIWKQISDAEHTLTENLMVSKDPYESFSLRGQVLGLRFLSQLKTRYESELEEKIETLQQLRQEAGDKE